MQNAARVGEQGDRGTRQVAVECLKVAGGSGKGLAVAGGGEMWISNRAARSSSATESSGRRHPCSQASTQAVKRRPAGLSRRPIHGPPRVFLKFQRHHHSRAT